VWENEQLRASLARGLAQSAAGETVDLGDFSQAWRIFWHYGSGADETTIITISKQP